MEDTRGILNPRLGEKKFTLTRYAPAHDLLFFIDRYWLIRWDLRGQPPYTQETLSNPCVHLVFERGNTLVWGVDTGKFARRLEGVGQVFGIKFRPGAFYPFVKTPVSRFTDRTIRLHEAFGVEAAPLEDALFAFDEAGQVDFVDAFLRQRLPERDETIVLLNQIIDCITDNRSITKVDDVVKYFGLGKRHLQRLFSQYVGVSPKWVIQRFRLHEAAEQMTAGSVPDWAKLAQSLGYFDQAHFIKDFKTVVGKTPLEYARSLESE